ncbi:hypothetical protein [Pedobacter cryotolerans]|uniref:Uncharacterized protein n=1 Tax=Pedobacter cryotolerans TaxID=2571270 RepID=A0A4U1C7W0_9SPHI|nr:hypothetical protein [Pedobacter cryotolerans]TKC01759.1 hypothetical protein FA045_05765 [Pedobacter cryotolerans]
MNKTTPLTKKYWLFLKLAIALAISFAVFILTSFFSEFVVNKYLIQSHLANYSFYEGFADLSTFCCYVLASALLVFDKLRGNAFLLAIGFFIAILLLKCFLVDVVAHYFRFYGNTQQNGNYSFEIFKNKLANQWDSLLFEFTNLGQLLSFTVWQFVALLGICYLSILVRNKLVQ